MCQHQGKVIRDGDLQESYLKAVRINGDMEKSMCGGTDPSRKVSQDGERGRCCFRWRELGGMAVGGGEGGLL